MKFLNSFGQILNHSLYFAFLIPVFIRFIHRVVLIYSRLPLFEQLGVCTETDVSLRTKVSNYLAAYFTN